MRRPFFCFFVALVGSLVACGAGCGGGETGDADGAAIDGGTDRRDGAGPSDAGGAFDSGPLESCATPGAIETVPCGACGTVERFCTAEGSWSYATCENQGGCVPGTTGSLACGSCGAQPARCTTECVWEATGACTGEGECAPGERTRTSTGCAAGETHELLCGDSCRYAEVSPCQIDGCPTPGAIESVPCGSCGTAQRFCTAAHVWEYDACVEGGACTPGTTRTASCGLCGSRVERCTASCAWDTGDACTGEGECSPGDARRTSAGCGAGQTRLETCGTACTFEATGPCEGGTDGGPPRDAGTRDAGPRDGGPRDGGARDGAACGGSGASCLVDGDCCFPICFGGMCF